MATETPTKVIVDCSTGEETILPLTADEIAQLETDRAAAEAALAKLAALGLTEEEAAALAG